MGLPVPLLTAPDALCVGRDTESGNRLPSVLGGDALANADAARPTAPHAPPAKKAALRLAQAVIRPEKRRGAILIHAGYA